MPRQGNQIYGGCTKGWGWISPRHLARTGHQRPPPPSHRAAGFRDRSRKAAPGCAARDTPAITATRRPPQHDQRRVCPGTDSHSSTKPTRAAAPPSATDATSRLRARPRPQTLLEERHVHRRISKGGRAAQAASLIVQSPVTGWPSSASIQGATTGEALDLLHCLAGENTAAARACAEARRSAGPNGAGGWPHPGRRPGRSAAARLDRAAGPQQRQQLQLRPPESRSAS